MINKQTATKPVWVNGREYTYVDMSQAQRIARGYDYIAFDGCHKIYIFNNDGAPYFDDVGYQIDNLTAELLEEYWNTACSLRFIEASISMRTVRAGNTAPPFHNVR